MKIPNLKIVNIFSRSLRTKFTPFGSVGFCHNDEEIEIVVVRKKKEAIDPSWFSQPTTDYILVLKGKLKVEFPESASVVLNPGHLMMLPKNKKCRAYSYPRKGDSETIFLAFYKIPKKLKGATH